MHTMVSSTPISSVSDVLANTLVTQGKTRMKLRRKEPWFVLSLLYSDLETWRLNRSDNFLLLSLSHWFMIQWPVQLTHYLNISIKIKQVLIFLFFIFIIIVYTFISVFCISPEFSNEKLIRARFSHQFWVPFSSVFDPSPLPLIKHCLKIISEVDIIFNALKYNQNMPYCWEKNYVCKSFSKSYRNWYFLLVEEIHSFWILQSLS